MESTQAIQDVKEKTFPATVVKVIDSCKLAINRGKIHGLKQGQRLLVYSLSPQEIQDPNTGESLGYLEMVKGTGQVIHLQEKMCTIESDKQKTLTRKIQNNIYFGLKGEIVESERNLVPFEEPEMGDLVKPI